jgi:hypothetical protein
MLVEAVGGFVDAVRRQGPLVDQPQSWRMKARQLSREEGEIPLHHEEHMGRVLGCETRGSRPTVRRPPFERGAHTPGEGVEHAFRGHARDLWRFENGSHDRTPPA